MAWYELIVTMQSSRDMSMYWPSPLMWRCSSAARMAVVAYMPVSRSLMAMPLFIGAAPGSPSGTPVMLIRPPMPWNT